MNTEFQRRLADLVTTYDGNYDNLCVYKIANLLSAEGILTQNDINMETDFMRRPLAEANRLLFSGILPTKVDGAYIRLIELYRRLENHELADFLACVDHELLIRAENLELCSGSSKLESTKSSLLKAINRFYRDFSQIRLIPACPSSTVDLNEIWVNVVLKDKQGKNFKKNYEMCLEYAQKCRVPIIVQGEPGIGKSTLVKKIALDYAQGRIAQFKLILIAKLRDVPKADNLFDICVKWMLTNCSDLRDVEPQEQDKFIRALRNMEPNDILLVLDGLDESVTDCPQLREIYETDFFHFKYPVIITTRPYKVPEILCNHKICFLQGFELSQEIEFSNKYFCAQNTNCEIIQKNFVKRLESCQDLQLALSTPLLLQMALISEYSPETYRQTDLYKKLISHLIATYNRKHPNQRLEYVNDWLTCQAVVNLGKLAFYKLVDGEEGTLCFTDEDLMKYKVGQIFVNIGILTTEENWAARSAEKPQRMYSFLHKTVQEFFAGAVMALSYQTYGFMRKIKTTIAKPGRNIIDGSLYETFASICSNGGHESWRTPTIQQVCYFFAGIMSDMGNTSWGPDFYMFSISTEDLLQKISIENPKLDISLQVEKIGFARAAWSPETLHKTKYISPLHPGIFQFKLPNHESSIATCIAANMKMIRYEDTTSEIKTTLKLFSNFALSGTEEQLKKFCSHLLPHESSIDHLGLRFTSDGPENVQTQQWPCFTDLKELRIDMPSSTWPDSLEILLHSICGLNSLLIRMHPDIGGTFDFSQVDIASHEKLEALLIMNFDLSADTDQEQLIKQLKCCANLKLLSLRNSRLTARKLLYLLRSLKVHNKKFEYLLLVWNQGIGKDILGFKRCCQELAEFPNFTHLNLNGCGLTDSALDALMNDFIGRSASFKQLQLRCNRFQSEEKLSKLKKMVKNNQIYLRL